MSFPRVFFVALSYTVLAVTMTGCISQDNFITPTGSIEKIITFDGGNKVVFSPDGKYVVGMKEWTHGQAERANARMYDITTGKLVRTFRLEEDSDIFGAAFSPDGTLLATCGGESNELGTFHQNWRVAVFDVATGKGKYYLRNSSEDMHAITFSPDGRSVVFFWKGAVRFWDYRSFDDPDSIPLYFPDTGAGIKYSRDGSKILLSPLAMVDVEKKKEIPTEMGTMSYVWQSVALSADGRKIFGCGDNALASMDAATLTMDGLIEERHDDDEAGSQSSDRLHYTTIDTDPTGSYFATGDNFGRLRVWRASNGELVASGDGMKVVHCVAFAPDGRTIAVGDNDYKVTIWRIND